jgi:hypothetical protein
MKFSKIHFTSFFGLKMSQKCVWPIFFIKLKPKQINVSSGELTTVSHNAFNLKGLLHEIFLKFLRFFFC